jgi:chloramphenicol 3-O phosphotransferase
MAATVILLNGAGSAGKSSLARALQNVLSEPWLHVALDSFLEMFPDRFHDDPEGFLGRNEIDEDKPQIAIEIGAAGRRLLKGMRLSVAAMAGAGNNLIVDDVILDGGLSEYEALLSEIRFLKVGVFEATACSECRVGSSPAFMSERATTWRSIRRSPTLWPAPSASPPILDFSAGPIASAEDHLRASLKA